MGDWSPGGEELLNEMGGGKRKKKEKNVGMVSGEDPDREFF